MRKGIKIVIWIGIFLVLTLGLIFSLQKVEVQPKFETSVKQGVLAEKVNLIIDFGEGEIKKFETEIRPEMTNYDLLKKGAEKLDLNLKTKTYDIGIFIEAIGDKENGEDGKYWLYYVNDEMPMMAADKKEINLGDKVEWRFEKSPF